MPTVPLIEQNVQTRGIGAPTVTQRPADPGFGDAFAKIGGEVMKISNEATERGNQVAMIEAQRKIDEWEANTLFNPTTGAFTKKGKSAFALPEETSAQFQQDMKAIREGLSNDEQKTMFDKMSVSRWGTIAPRLQTYVRGQMDGYSKGQEEATKESSANRATLYWNDEKTSESSIKSIADITEMTGMRDGKSAEEIANDKLNATSEARLRVLTAMADKDPVRASEYFTKNSANFSGKDYTMAMKITSGVREGLEAKKIVQGVAGQVVTGDSDSIINYVMNDLEGGDKVITDGNGALAKYGINAEHNKGADVANLTAEQAAAIYKEKYWAQNGIDKLPAPMRLPVFDAAVNGFDKDVLGMTLNEAVEKSGGDPHKFLEIRKEYYQKLAESNPDKYGPNLKGWMNRLSNINAQLDASDGVRMPLVEAFAAIDAKTNNPEVAEKAKALYKQQYDLVDQNRKQVEEDASRAVAEYDARGEEPPMGLVVRMNPKQQAERTEKNYDPIEYERIRQQVSYGQPVNLEEYRWRMTPKQFTDLLNLQSDPVQQTVAREVDSQINNSLTQILGKSKPKTKEDYSRISRYRDTVYNSIAAQEKISGKRVTPQDVETITDRLAMENIGNSWWNPMNWGVTDENYNVTGIPRAQGQYLMGGEPVDYPTLIAALTIQARAQNLPVNDDVLAGLYQNAVKSGKIADKYK